MPHSSKETLSIGWCDNGIVDGKFNEGLVYSIMMAPTVGVPVNNALRIKGNRIARQRMELFNMWADQAKTDWLLWVDSDVVLTKEVLKLLWDTADKVSRPVVSGVYFIFKDHAGGLPVPMPTIFREGRTNYEINYIHPLPENQIIDIDHAGMGLVLMHKSIVESLRATHPNQNFFQEEDKSNTEFVGEDIVFFRKLKQAGVKAVAHTGALVKHMKIFPFDVSYYSLFWSTVQREEEKREEEAKND
jgi:hypothetical protein